MNALTIRDRAGVISVAELRRYFEKSIEGTKSFKSRFKTADIETDADGFCGYKDPDTHNFWLGFAIGMRCAERVEGDAV